jgi:hypothetical protein
MNRSKRAGVFGGTAKYRPIAVATVARCAIVGTDSLGRRNVSRQPDKHERIETQRPAQRVDERGRASVLFVRATAPLCK